MQEVKKGLRKAWFGIILAILILGSSTYVLGWSSLLTVKEVIVTGAPNPSEAYAIQHNFHVGDKMARLETQRITALLKKYTWLDHSTITRNWFKGYVTVRVWTRTPVAQFQSHFVDQNGIMFDLPNVDTTHLPTISGSDAASAKFATNLLFSLTPTLRAQVSDVTVRGGDWAILTITDLSLNRKISVVWGDLSETALKVKVYQALIALPENVNIKYVDVSAPHAPIVR